MQAITYEQAKKKQLRTVGTYFEQAANLITGTVRLLAAWFWMTTVSTVALLIILFLMDDRGSYSVSDLRELVKLIFTMTGIVSVIVCLIKSTRYFTDVFEAKAWEEVRRHKDIHDKVQSEIDTAESVLLQYGLITKADREREHHTDEQSSFN